MTSMSLLGFTHGRGRVCAQYSGMGHQLLPVGRLIISREQFNWSPRRAKPAGSCICQQLVVGCPRRYCNFRPGEPVATAPKAHRAKKNPARRLDLAGLGLVGVAC